MPKSGNKHRLQHGLYAQRISNDEQAALQSLPVGSLEGEIAYLRTVVARLALILEKNGLAPGSTRQLSEETRRTLRLLEAVMARLLTFVNHHVLLSGEASEYELLVEAGKQSARKALGLTIFLNER
jgi:hypothetical protein